jgi:hydroxymethylbilane synthase
MPAVLPEGLTIAAVLPREDPHDAIVLPVRLKPNTSDTSDTSEASDTSDTSDTSEASEVSGFRRTIATIDELVAVLGQTPSIGTGSVRRIAQLTRLFPGARFTPIRGNLDTRLRKLDQGEHDALVLAAAGLRRLGFQSRISLALPASACVPAPGQGIVAIETRDDDGPVRRAVERVNDPAAGAALAAERSLVEALGGGCQTPVGALAAPADGDMLELVAIVVALDGSKAVRERALGARSDAAALGAAVGARLLANGADEILEDARRQTVTGPQSSVMSQKSAAMTDE